MRIYLDPKTMKLLMETVFVLVRAAFNHKSVQNSENVDLKMVFVYPIHKDVPTPSSAKSKGNVDIKNLWAV